MNVKDVEKLRGLPKMPSKKLPMKRIRREAYPDKKDELLYMLSLQNRVES
jgi:hypothetical protein